MAASSIKSKIVIVGDGACGKTSVVARVGDKTFESNYNPTVFENTVHGFDVNGVFLEMALWDTAGQEDYTRLNTLAYSNSDLLVICYSIAERTTYENVKERWLMDAKTNCEGVPIILIGNKIDLRTSNTVTKEEGEKLAHDIGAIRYFECSAKDNMGIKEAFQEMAELLVTKKGAYKKKSKFLCC
ncbi:GTP-binding protein rho1 [Spraguea lophii 42_110]|uniref:GTP-binding protein rho1 n=1 Tax=Spraguea lophii (strain 42_110) TaxID=1358809 RepID=S7WAG2_SPRLO|nr:GTP-binding protein rho1 [Spraguea lophii 42_110]